MLGTTRTRRKEKASSKEGGRKGETIEISCVLGMGWLSHLGDKEVSQKEGRQTVGILLRNLMVAVSEDRSVKGPLLMMGKFREATVNKHGLINFQKLLVMSHLSL